MSHEYLKLFMLLDEIFLLYQIDASHILTVHHETVRHIIQALIVLILCFIFFILITFILTFQIMWREWLTPRRIQNLIRRLTGIWWASCLMVSISFFHFISLVHCNDFFDFIGVDCINFIQSHLS